MSERIDIETPLRKELINARYEVDSAEREALRYTAKVESAIADVRAALDNGHSVPSGVSGGPFVGSDANDLTAALVARERAYRKLRDTEGLIEAFGLNPETL